MPKKKHKALGKSHRERIGVLELFEMFPDEESARKWFENLRWPNEEKHCPIVLSVEALMMFVAKGFTGKKLSYMKLAA